MNVRVVRECFQEMVESFKELEGVLFTSFMFSPDFFEPYVLPIALGECLRDTPSQVAATDEALRKVQITVLYDAAGLVEDDKRLSYDAVPIHLGSNAVFHSKIIFAHGVDHDDKKHFEVMVGSANLTRAGWGSNVEAAALKEFSLGSHLGKDLRQMLDRYDKRSNARGALLSFRTALPLPRHRERWSNPAVRLVWRTEEPLRDYVAEQLPRGGTLCVCSPYFGQGKNVTDLIRSLREECGDLEFRIVPGPDPDGQFDLCREDAERLAAEPNIRWFQWKRLGSDSEVADRLVHAKLYVAECEGHLRIAIGSHNFTNRGFGGKGNFEASLWFKPDSNQVSLPLKTLSPDEFVERCPQEKKSSAPEPAAAFCTVTIDWEEGRLLIEQVWPKRQSSWTLKLPWLDEELPFREAKSKIDDDEVVSRAICETRAFTVRGDGQVKFRGLIGERGWREYRPDPPIGSADDILEAWLSPNQDTEDGKAHEKLSAQEERDSDVSLIGAGLEQDKADLFDSYFNRFRAIRQKRQRIMGSNRRALGPVRRMLFGSCTSVEALLNQISSAYLEPETGTAAPADIGTAVGDLVTLWELDGLCSSAAKRFAKLSADSKRLRKTIRDQAARVKDLLSKRLDESELGAPFEGIPFIDAVGWFRKRLAGIQS